MLKTLITAVIGLLAMSVNAQQGYLIKGKVTGKHEGKKVMLTYENGPNHEKVNDSVFVKNGTFQFKGKVADVVRARLALKELVVKDDPTGWMDRVDADEQELFLENANFSVTGVNVRDALIKGGAAQADYSLFKGQLKPFEDQMKPLTKRMMQYMNEKNKPAQEELFPQLQALSKGMSQVRDDFFKKHPDSYVSLYLLSDGSASVIDPVEFEPVFHTLSPRIRNSIIGKELSSRLKTAKKVDVGRPQIDFVQNDTEGKPVSLASYKGKYILLEFWASWCGPCRAENPNLVKAYHKFKDRNFEIIAVSLDHNKDLWLKAIAADGLPWIHVSDLNGVKNAVATMYDAKAVPQNFLIGPDGIILAKGLRGEELEKKLTELIKD